MTWIKLVPSIDIENKIYLPEKIYGKLKPQMKIQFGQREMIVTVCISKEWHTNTFANPLLVKCSQNIIAELLVLEAITYQITLWEDCINIGPVIGLLLGNQQYYYHDRHMAEYRDAMSSYDGVGGLIVAFKTSSINWEEMTVYGLFFDNKFRKWKYIKAPIPSAIFRRGFNSGNEEIGKLIEITHGKVFNAFRHDKWSMFDRLQQDANLSKYLPETSRITDMEVIRKFLNKYSQIILKPSGLSRGRGICIMQKVGKDTFALFDYRNPEQNDFFKLKQHELEKFFEEGNFFNREYIIQPFIELAKINGSPFDIRIVMQKNTDHSWQCNGIECRHAGEKELLTNISLGGEALPIKQAAKLAFGNDIDADALEEEVIDISKDFCELMDKTGKLYGEFGIDIAVDKNKKCWFIEANVRPTFKGFKTFDYQMYLKLCCTPIFYAAALSGFGGKNEQNGNEI